MTFSNDAGTHTSFDEPAGRQALEGQTRREAEDSRACGSRLHLCLRFDWFPSYPMSSLHRSRTAILRKTVALLPCLRTPVFAYLTISPIHLISLAGIAFRRRPTKSYKSDSVKGWAKLLAAQTVKPDSAKEGSLRPLSHSFSMGEASCIFRGSLYPATPPASPQHWP